MTTHAIRRARPLLGTFVKGYCIDRAVAALKRAGASSGLVNAGGDLRAFGAHAWVLSAEDAPAP